MLGNSHLRHTLFVSFNFLSSILFKKSVNTNIVYQLLVTSFTPTSGSIRGGTRVTINGAGFRYLYLYLNSVSCDLSRVPIRHAISCAGLGRGTGTGPIATGTDRHKIARERDRKKRCLNININT